MNNILIIIYPYQELNLLYNLNIDNDDLLEEDNVIMNELKNINTTVPRLCNHDIDVCECIPILNVYYGVDLNNLNKYINNTIQYILIVSYDASCKIQLKDLINNINNNISILKLSNQKYAFDIFKIFLINNNIIIGDSVKEIIIKPTS